MTIKELDWGQVMAPSKVVSSDKAIRFENKRLSHRFGKDQAGRISAEVT